MIALALAMERLLQLLPLETPQEVRIVQGNQKESEDCFFHWCRFITTYNRLVVVIRFK